MPGHAELRLIRALPLLVTLPLAGCLDFLTPNLPAAGRAVAQVAIFIEDNTSTNTSTVNVAVSVIPGMAQSGEFRKIPDDTLMVDGFRIVPKAVHGDGTRDYQAQVQLPPPTGPVTIQFPVVAGLGEAPPPLRWYALRRLNILGSVALTPAGDLFLHVDTTKPPETPPPANPQWVLQLNSPRHSFQLGADGSPPPTLHVPAEFVPADTSNLLTASLLIFHGSQLTPGAEYILNASLNQRLNWNVVRRPVP